jgi:hypothetical protein
MDNTLSDLLERAETWPKEAQAELLRVAVKIEKEHRGVYVLNADQRNAIAVDLKDIAENRFANPADVEAVFAKCRS